jgi:hypothetical protein
MKTNLPICTVGYLIRGMRDYEEILLGEKATTPKAVKRKIAGKLIGYGGDFEPGTDASIRESFKRELTEESSNPGKSDGLVVEVRNIEVLAKILIRDDAGDRLTLYYIFVREWMGEAHASREIFNPRWYHARSLPWNILGADKLILPKLVNGQKLTGWVKYDTDMNVVGHDLQPVETIDEALS